MRIFDSVCFVKSDADINPNRYRVFFQPQFSHNIHYATIRNTIHEDSWVLKIYEALSTAFRTLILRQYCFI